MIKYKKITIDNVIYIKVFTDGTVSYITVSTDGVLNITNNETAFPELTKVCEEHFEMIFQELSILKYLNLICFSLPLVSVLIRLITPWN